MVSKVQSDDSFIYVLCLNVDLRVKCFKEMPTIYLLVCYQMKNILEHNDLVSIIMVLNKVMRNIVNQFKANKTRPKNIGYQKYL